LITNDPGIGSIWKGNPIESLISSNNVSTADSINISNINQITFKFRTYLLILISVHLSISFEMNPIDRYLPQSLSAFLKGDHTIWY
jgi:hypothetical protein